MNSDFARDEAPRRLYQYSLRSLLIGITIIALVGGWIGARLEREKRQKAIIEEFSKGGARIEYDGKIEGYRATVWSDASLKQICDLDELRSLEIKGVAITEAGLKPLERMIHLQSLTFSTERIVDGPMVHLGGLKQLRFLVFSDGVVDTIEGKSMGRGLPPQITDVGMKRVGGLTWLQGLFLSGKEVTDAGVMQLKTLHKLEVLQLWHTQVSDAGIGALSGLSKLQRLSLFGCRVTDSGLETIKGFQDLRELDLGDCNVTDRGIEKLSALKKLRRLQLSSTRATKDGVAALQIALPNCKIEL
jgi:internalin A